MNLLLNKIKNVNDFFNQITYKTDAAHWKQKDYWATPFEFMGRVLVIVKIMQLLNIFL
jgi:predicted transglutaminase-like cysteine proteinase